MALHALRWRQQMTDPYRSFLEAKVKLAEAGGFEVPVSAFHRTLQERGHQALMAQWLVRMGRAACFASFGLGKGGVQQEVVRVVLDQLRAGHPAAPAVYSQEQYL